LYWDWNYRQGLVPLKTGVGALWFGTGVHVALATYYRYGSAPKDNWERWYNHERETTLAETYGSDFERIEKFNDLGSDMMSRYLPYAKQNDGWEVVGVEYPLRYEILPGVFIVGSLDLLVRKNGKLWVVDHKTCASFIDPEHLVFDDQMAMYLWLVWKVTGEVPGGAIYSMLRKTVPAEPMLVYKGTALSKAKDIDTTVEKYLEAIRANNFDERDYADVLARIGRNEFFRRETVIRSARELAILDEQVTLEATEMTKQNVSIYPTMTRDCTWSCQFVDLCRTRLTGGDVQFTIDANFRETSDTERYHQRWLEPV